MSIVKWLRAEAELIALPRLKEAADEIERLRVMASEGPHANVRLSEENDRLIAEIERLRADVKSYAGEIAKQQDENDQLRVEIDRMEKLGGPQEIE